MFDTWTEFRKVFIAVPLSIMLAGCGGSGGDTASTNQITTDPNISPTSTNTAAGSTWDQMEWDNGTWSN